MINTHIIIAVGIIGASGIIRVWTGQGSQGSSITKVLLGADVLLIVLAVVDFFGGPLSVLAGSIAMLAAFVVVLTQIPWQTLFNKLNVNAGQNAPGGQMAPTTHATPANQPLSPQ